MVGTIYCQRQNLKKKKFQKITLCNFVVFFRYVPVALDQVCTHYSSSFGPFLYTDLLQIFRVSLGNIDFHLLSKISNRVQIRGLATPGP